ncbi:MAG: hypothetical protein JWP34_4737 [Massilia sp.]|nr:hypothetical protein [Massilia sp.]
MSLVVITPNAARNLRKAVREGFADYRARIAKVRELRATGRILDREDADGILWMVLHEHRQHVQRYLHTLRTAKVEKGSNLSPRAQARLIAKHGA